MILGLTFDQFHFALATVTGFFFLAALFIGRDAMRKGLTYEGLAATLWVLFALALGRLWHAAFEVMELNIIWGEWPEIWEYLLYILSLLAFCRLMWKSYHIKTPHRAFKGKL